MSERRPNLLDLIGERFQQVMPGSEIFRLPGRSLGQRHVRRLPVAAA